jgi:hypothetical protein
MTYNKDFESIMNNVVQITLKNDEIVHGRLINESIRFLELDLKRGDTTFIRKCDIKSVLDRHLEPHIEYE